MANDKDNDKPKGLDPYRGCLGTRVTASEAREWLLASISDNISRAAAGQPRASLDIWGPPGMGKTSIVKQLAGTEVPWEGKTAPIAVIDIPLAQIEEMGDILGYPVEEAEMERYAGAAGAISESRETIWVKAADAVIAAKNREGYAVTGGKRTTYAPPAWAPKEARPGVLLFDDGNRASQRIMKGLMQLIQDYRTIAWAIPAGWTIVFTGNPDNALNQVTRMDSAQITRMRHITLKADAAEWIAWAEAEGIDARGINAIHRNPELLENCGERSNARCFTEFFRCLSRFPDLTNKTQLRRCTIEANASLDETTAASVLTFLIRDNEMAITPEMILAEPEKAAAEMTRLMNGGTPRVDIAAITMARLTAYLSSPRYQFAEAHLEPLRAWYSNETIPRDLRYSSLARLQNGAMPLLRKICTDSKMGKILHEFYTLE